MESDAVQLPVSHKAWAWFEANKKQTLWAAGGILVVGLVISFYIYHQDETEVAASEALSNVSVPQLAGAGKDADMAQAYLKVTATYPNSAAGARALLLAAANLFVQGKYAEAKTQFDRFTRDHRDSPFLGEALLGIAACLDADGKSHDAMSAYKDIIDHHAGDNVVPQARFALGRLYEAQNEPEQARNMFEEVERTNPYGSLGSEAGMRLEELKAKYPNLFAPKTSMTNSTVLTIPGGKK